jgi:hypothetical protein
VLCSIPLAATGVKNYLFGDHLLATGVSGFTRHLRLHGRLGTDRQPNDLALMLNLLIPIAGALALNEKGFKRSVAVGAMLLAIAGVVVTFSRAGFLTLAATFVMFLAVLPDARRPASRWACCSWRCAPPPLLPSGYMDRLSTITDIEADKTGVGTGPLAGLQGGHRSRYREPARRRRTRQRRDRPQQGTRALDLAIGA